MSGGSSFPPRESVVNVIRLLHENGIAVVNSKTAYEQLKQNQGNPQFCVLLAFVFQAAECPVPELPLTVPWVQYRQLAGITLKNNIAAARHSLGEEAVKEAAASALGCLRDPPDARIARAASQIVVKVTTLTSFQWWEQSGLGSIASILLNDLLPSGGLKTLSALYALQYLMEDLPKQVGEASTSIVSQVSALALSSGTPSEIKKAAFRMCFNIYEQSALLDWNVDTLSPLQRGLVDGSWTLSSVCTSLLEQACYGDTAFMILVLRTCSLLLDYVPYFPAVGDREKERLAQFWAMNTVNIVTSVRNRDENYTELVAAAIDFITVVLTSYNQSGGDTAAAFLAAPIGGSIPGLVSSLIFFSFMSNEEASSITESDDYLIRDNTPVSISDPSKAKDISEDELLDDDEAAMTLRRSALRCVEALSEFSSSSTFNGIIGQVAQLWSAPEWQAQEAGIVLVGTIATTCAAELESFLPGLVQSLLGFVRDTTQHICVSSIAMWTLSRLFESILTVSPDCVPGIISEIIKRVGSRSKRIQITSVSALTTAFSVLESYGEVNLLVVHYPALLSSICECLPFFSTRNLSSLIDLTCMVMRNLNDQPSLEKLGSFLKEERGRRARSFEATYTAAYVNCEPNALVDKDVFSMDRAIIQLLSLTPDSSFALSGVSTWSDVLQDIVKREVEDDIDLVFNTLLMCTGYLNTIPTTVLHQWLQETSWGLPTLAIQLLTRTASRQVRVGAITLLVFITRALQRGAFPDKLRLAVLQFLTRELPEEEEPAFKADMVRLLTVLTRTSPPALQEAALGALRVAHATIRSDVFGDSLHFFARMTFDLCSVLDTVPESLGLFNMEAVSRLMAQAANSVAKSESTIALCTALSTAHPEVLASCMSSVLVLVYSWQQAAANYPGTLEALTRLLHTVMRSCPGLLESYLQAVPSGLQDMLRSTYALA